MSRAAHRPSVAYAIPSNSPGRSQRPLLTLNLVSAAATREEMSAARLPIQYRDSCAHLLIPLNRCRYEEFYLPWKCEVGNAGEQYKTRMGIADDCFSTAQDERHSYEKCQYEEFKKRVAKMDELRAAKNGERSN